MKTAYFKYRQRFDFSPHSLDTGRPLFWSKLHEDNHLLYRLIKLDESRLEAFYQHHLNLYLAKNPQELYVWGLNCRPGGNEPVPTKGRDDRAAF